jgi:endonuclease III related protein
MNVLEEAYKRLSEHYGTGEPASTGSVFERLVRVILQRNSTWQRVEQSVERLRMQGPLEPETLRSMSDEVLLEAIAASGYAKQKVRWLRSLLRFLERQGDAPIEQLLEHGTYDLRAELLQVNGIGPETADTLLMQALDRPTFPVNTHFARVAKRHGWIEQEADYEALRELAESQLPDDPRRFQELHRLIARVGKDHCGSRPDCTACPLQPLLPSSGVCEPCF